LDRFDEAKATIRDANQRKLDYSDMHRELYRMAFVERDREGMAQQVSWAARQPGVEHAFVMFESQSAASAGRLKDARRLSERATNMARQEDEKEVAAGYEGLAAIRESLFANGSEARRHATTALRLSHSRDVEYLAAFALAASGQSKEAERIAADLGRQYPIDTVAQFVCLPQVRARLAMARKEYKKAIDTLEPVKGYELGFEATLTPSNYITYLHGEALLADDRAGEAASEFQKILSHKGLTANDPIGPLAQLNLARAYARRGDPAQARQAYEAFFELWKDADADSPILKDARKEFSRLR
jgi:outer membrane protein assembly factor BamD (BamD/ComL family)